MRTTPPRKLILISIFFVATLFAFLFPEEVLPNSPEMPEACAGCAKECLVNVCIDWDAPGENSCVPGPNDLGCCRPENYEMQCDPDCVPPDRPPKINSTLNCSVWGVNGWCIGNETLDLTASDLQGASLLISGDLNGNPFACEKGATFCAIPLSEGIGTANYSVLSALGLKDSGTKNWLRDSILPAITGDLSGVAGDNGWFTSSVELSASVTESGSGLSAFETSLDGINWTSYTAPLTFSDGSRIVQIRAIDIAGNVEVMSHAINIDSVAPLLNKTLTGISGANGWYISSVLVEASAGDSEPSSGFVFEITTDGVNWASYTAPLTLNEGTYDLQIRVKDTAGNQVANADFVNVDTTPPTVDGTLSGILGSGNWYISAVETSASVADATSGIAYTEHAPDGGVWRSYIAPVKFSDGQHSIQFRTTDMSGLSAETKVFAFQVDTKGPHIKLPSRWYIWESGEFIIKDADSKIVFIRYEITDPQNRWQKVERTWTPSLHEFSHTISWNRVFADGIVAPIGNYNVTVYAEDAAGNKSQKSASIIIPQPNAAPLPTFTPTPTPETVVIEPPATEEAFVIAAAVPTMTPTPLPQAIASEEEKEATIFGFESEPANPTRNSQSTNSNILWGTTAAAAIGAFAAEAAKRKKERDARRARWEKKKKERAKLQAIWDTNGAALYEENKAVKEAARKTRKLALMERILGFKEKFLNPPPPSKPEPGLAEVQARMAIEAQKEVELDSATLSYMAMGNAVEEGKFSKEEYDTVAAQKPEEKKSWWEKTVDWVDEHQAEVSLGIGIVAGIVAIAVTGGTTAPFVAAALVAQIVAVTGGVVVIGTAGLNMYYGRGIGTNAGRNLAITGITIFVVAGAGIFLRGAPQGIATYCAVNPNSCANVQPVLNTFDVIEERWLGAKMAYQIWRGDPAAADTMQEIILEQGDGGMPGNTTAREIGEEFSKLTMRYDDDATRFLNAGEDVIDDVIKNFGDDAAGYGDDLIDNLDASVLGRLDDTEVAKELGIAMLDDPNWSMGRNFDYLQEGVDNGDAFYIGSPINEANLLHERFGINVFARELDMLLQNGYRRVGDYLVPGP